jgi:hypothetical protein
MSKRAISLLFIIILAVSSLIVIETVAALASIPKPSVPEFTLEYVDASYEVPPTTTSTTDPYTNKTTTTTIPGYHVENKTIQATIANNIGASYYNFRYKGHYTDKWNYYPFSPSSSGYSLGDTFSVPYKASTSSYTVAALPAYFFQSIPAGGEVDVQVQALFGNFDAIPYGHIIDVGGPTYDFIFKGETSDWSNTQTITINGSAPTTTPTTSPSQYSTATPDSQSDANQQGLSWTEISLFAALGVIIVLLIVIPFICRRQTKK